MKRFLIITIIFLIVLTGMALVFAETDSPENQVAETLELSDKETLSIAEKYLTISPYSRQGLITELVCREKIDAETVERIVNGMNENWAENAIEEVKQIQATENYTEDEIREILRYERYTQEEIRNAMAGEVK